MFTRLAIKVLFFSCGFIACTENTTNNNVEVYKGTIATDNRMQNIFSILKTFNVRAEEEVTIMLIPTNSCSRCSITTIASVSGNLPNGQKILILSSADPSIAHRFTKNFNHVKDTLLIAEENKLAEYGLDFTEILSIKVKSDSITHWSFIK